MIDWHSHILPGMDDGSRDVDESLALLAMQKEQGISTVIATPHFYANNESVSSFLRRRRESYERLSATLPEGLPNIRLGAEISYYEGISRLEGLEDLRIEGTRLLLMEMPMACWSEYSIRELSELSARSGIQLVLAHVERYMSLQKPGTVERLLDCGIINQVNASFFVAFSSRRKAISLIKRGIVHLVGSDCHSIKFRPPHIGEAYSRISKKLGTDFLSQMEELGEMLIAEN